MIQFFPSLLNQKKAGLLLDEFPNAAAAYSLRLLRSDYTGNCIQVTRSSDGALQDIGFVDGVLDTASLLSFVGSANGFVRTWYDQSGNNINVIQNFSINRQPKIVNLGVIESQGSKPTINFDGVDDVLYFGSSGLLRNVSSGSVFSSYAIKSPYTQEKIVYAISTNNQGTNRLNHGGFTGGFYFFGRRLDGISGQAVIMPTIPPPNILLQTSIIVDYQATSANIYLNGSFDVGTNSFLTAGNTSNTNSEQFCIGSSVGGALGAGANHKDVNFTELVLYHFDQSTNRTGIEQNINAYYNIF